MKTMKLVPTLSKTSPMTLFDRICWSVMASRRSVSQYRIHEYTGLSREAIRMAVKVLHGFRLAKEEGGRWVAVEPDELSSAWFSWVKDSEGKPLGQRLRYTKVVPKETGDGIAVDCLLGLMRSLARRGPAKSSCRRLKKMTGISDVTIKRRLKGFAEKGLLADVTFGRRDVSWQLAVEQVAEVPKDAVVERYEEDRPRRKRAKRKVAAEVTVREDPMKRRLLDAGLRLHSRTQFDKGDALPCGCVMTTTRRPIRLDIRLGNTIPRSDPTRHSRSMTPHEQKHYHRSARGRQKEAGAAPHGAEP
jgi:hypothetical protein